MIVFTIIGYWCYLIILVINILLYTYTSRKRLFWVRTAAVYLWGMLAIQIASDIARNSNSDNLFLSHLYFYYHFIVLSIFYFKVLDRINQRKTVLISVVSVTCFLILQYIAYPNLLLRFNLLEVFFTNYFLIVFSLMYIYNNLSNKKTVYYFNMAVLIYSVLSLSSFLLGNIMTGIVLDISVYTWCIHIYGLILFQVLITWQWFKSFYSKRT